MRKGVSAMNWWLNLVLYSIYNWDSTTTWDWHSLCIPSFRLSCLTTGILPFIYKYIKLAYAYMWSSTIIPAFTALTSYMWIFLFIYLIFVCEIIWLWNCLRSLTEQCIYTGSLTHIFHYTYNQKGQFYTFDTATIKEYVSALYHSWFHYAHRT